MAYSVRFDHSRRIHARSRRGRHWGVLGAAALAAAISCLALTGARHAAASAHALTGPVIHILGAAHPPGLNPYIVTIRAGGSVTFANDAGDGSVHSVVAEDGSFTSPPLRPGQQWTMSLTQQGTHIYHDPTAFSRIVGLIVVVPASTQLLPTAAPGAQATVIAQAYASRTAGNAGASASSGGTTLWIVVIVVLIGIAGGAAFLYRKRQGKGA